MSKTFDPFALSEFARYYGFHYDSIDPAGLVEDLLAEMERGLRGQASSLPLLLRGFFFFPAFIRCLSVALPPLLPRNGQYDSPLGWGGCVLQDETIVEKNASLDCIITDNSVVISENRNMMGYRTYPVYIERARVI